MLWLALDGVIAVLLVLSLVLGLKLHLALSRLRDDNTDFDRLVGAIDAATERARSTLDDLKQTASEVGERLTSDTDQAQRLLDDLRFLCERGEHLANRVAEQIESSRARPPSARHDAAAQGRSHVPQPDLERALRTLR